MANAQEFDAVVLCGGRGSRLGSMTDEIPKPLISVCGEPLLVHIVKQLLHEPDIVRLIFVVKYKQDVMVNLAGPIIENLARGVSVEWVPQEHPESEGALLTGVTRATSPWVTVRCGDDLIGDSVLRSLVRPMGVGTVMTRKIGRSELRRLRVLDDRVVGITSDENDPIMTYNLGMRTDVIVDWASQSVARHGPLIDDIEQFVHRGIFAVEGSDSVGLNRPEDYLAIERWCDVRMGMEE